MDRPHVVVIGAGFSGVAAAWAAARSGKSVVVLDDRAGASALYSGIVDGAAPSGDASELAARLGLVLGSESRAVATREGVIRPALGRQRALLDVAAHAGRRIFVADVGRDDWDARLLARGYAASAWARRTRTEFVAVAVDLLNDGAERRMSAYDFARCLDDPARVGTFGAALHTREDKPSAWLAGPWLGVRGDVASELSALAGCAVGEASSAPGGVAGARFELARDELLRELAVERVEARVSAVYSREGELCVELTDARPLFARAVVLALGGVAAGGILLHANPHTGQTRFELSLRANAALRLDGDEVDAGSSLWGPSLSRVGLGALERVGVRADAVGRVAAVRGLFAAGDVLAGRARTVLEALASGIVAGRGAASEP